jgi:hypothetical protein
LAAGLGTLDYGCSMPIDRNDLPNHLFGILDLDLSEEVIVPAIIAPLKQSRQCIASPAGAGPIFKSPDRPLKSNSPMER